MNAGALPRCAVGWRGWGCRRPSFTVTIRGLFASPSGGTVEVATTWPPVLFSAAVSWRGYCRGPAPGGAYASRWLGDLERD